MDVRVNNPEQLQIMQWNARSIRCHLSDLKIAAYTTKPHVIAVQETWLKKKHKTPNFISYYTHRVDRLAGKGGGVLFLVRKNLNYIIKDLVPFPGGGLHGRIRHRIECACKLLIWLARRSSDRAVSVWSFPRRVLGGMVIVVRAEDDLTRHGHTS